MPEFEGAVISRNGDYTFLVMKTHPDIGKGWELSYQNQKTGGSASGKIERGFSARYKAEERCRYINRDLKTKAEN